MWYEKLGFTENPLDVRSNSNLVGVDDIEESLFNYIKSGQICMIYGFTGSGKTSMLERVKQKEDLQEYKFIFISGDRIKPEHDLEKDLDSGRNFFDKLIRRKPRNYVILLDESHELSRYVTETVKGLWNTKGDDDYGVHSVVISQIQPKLQTNFSGSFKDRVGNKSLRMKKLSRLQLKEVISNRLTINEIDYSKRFEHDALDLIISSSGGSVRSLLDMLSHVFLYLDKFEENPLFGEDKINKNQVFNILSTMGIKMIDQEISPFQEILSSEKMQETIVVMRDLGSFDTLKLATALKINKSNASKIIHTLRKNNAIIFSHKEGKHKNWVLSPRLRHESVET